VLAPRIASELEAELSVEKLDELLKNLGEK